MEIYLCIMAGQGFCNVPDQKKEGKCRKGIGKILVL
jgi:hypothetical protein